VASAKSVLATLRPRAETTLAELIVQPYEALAALPEIDAKEIVGFPKPATLTTFRDALPDGRLRVVVQLFVRGILGSARIWAKGFFSLPGAQPVVATDEDLYEFF
jgi:hypothetical protein